MVLADASAGDITITIPNLVGIKESLEAVIVKMDSTRNRVIVVPDSSITVHDASHRNYVIRGELRGVRVYTNHDDDTCYYEKCDFEVNHPLPGISTISADLSSTSLTLIFNIESLEGEYFVYAY